MPSTIGKCKLFRIKHITLLEGETVLTNKREIAFFVIKCTFFGRKENTISLIAISYIYYTHSCQIDNASNRQIFGKKIVKIVKDLHGIC